MAKQKTSDYMSVTYRLDDANTNDTVRNVSMDWANRTPEEVRVNLNVWLTACGFDLEVVTKEKK